MLLLNSMDDKEIRLNLSKIFNWPKEDKLVNLEVEFYSGESCALVARKAIKAPFINNYLQLGVTIKIKYNQNENYIIVVIHRVKDQHQREVVGEAQINLDELQDRKIKYFTLGDMDKVLQIELSEPKVIHKDFPESDSIESRKIRNQKFLQERKKFLQTVNRNQAILKKSFSEKILSLLNDDRGYQDIQMMKNRKYEDQYEAYEESMIPSFGNENYEGEKNTGSQYDYPEHHSTRINSNDRMSSKVATGSKNKLMLNTLSIVPGSSNARQNNN